jgi:hypothetical protein
VKVIIGLGITLALALAVVGLSGCEITHHVKIKRSSDSVRPEWCNTASQAEMQKYPGQCL